MINDSFVLLIQLNASFSKSLALCHLKDAWLFATAIDKSDSWLALASTALYHLDIELGKTIKCHPMDCTVLVMYALVCMNKQDPNVSLDSYYIFQLSVVFSKPRILLWLHLFKIFRYYFCY